MKDCTAYASEKPLTLRALGVRNVPVADEDRDSGAMFRFGTNGEFSLRRAVSGEDRLRCWKLVYSEYLGMGYVGPKSPAYHYSVHDAWPETGTFFVETGGKAVGAVTVFCDSPLGLPADDLYGDELNGMRRAGRRPVEVGRLTLAADYQHDRRILAALFNVLSLYARCVRKATDLVIMVNPSHVKYYERMLLFGKAGPQRTCSAVGGAPAEFMTLDLERQKAVIRHVHGEGARPSFFADTRTLYRHFSRQAEEVFLVASLRRLEGKLPPAFVREWFVTRNPLIQRLDRYRRDCLHKRIFGETGAEEKRRRERGRVMAVICCECGREKDGPVWRKAPERDDVLYSHGYCPTCMRDALFQFGLSTGMVAQRDCAASEAAWTRTERSLGA